MLKISKNEDPCVIEIGTDEVGRGPLFGRVYTASVILPKDIETFDHSKMKDSKKFHSKKKIEEVADYIKENAIAWSVNYESEDVIDDINILQATQKSMHKSIMKTREKFIDFAKNNEIENYKIELLVDGNYFNPVTFLNENKTKLVCIPHTCVKGGDNVYSCIAAASILAKVERDKYIDDLCENHPELIEHYNIHSNKGYGAKVHIEGIKKHGITRWHRKSFGICKQYI
jgi:ribonuclease HII